MSSASNLRVIVAEQPTPTPTPISIPLPTIPTNFSLEAVSFSQINLSWTDSSHETTYRLYRQPQPNAPSWQSIGLLPANTTSYTDTNLQAETAYRYAIRAENAQGASEYVFSRYVTTSSPIPETDPPINQAPNQPSRPNGLSQAIVGQTYTYTSTLTDPDGDAMSYQFDFYNTQTHGGVGKRVFNLMTSGTTVSIDYVWPTPGRYTVRVRAYDEHGEPSILSEPLNVQVK
jgi:titin